MEKTPIIISFFTKDSLYQDQARKLISSCKELGLDYDICEIEEDKSWNEYCCYKAEFILKKLDEHGRAVIWTDVDSLIIKSPTLLLECKADCALRVNDNVAVEDPTKILSSTMFYANTASSRKLLMLWQKECERQLQKSSATLDQVCLRKVVLHYPTIVEMKRIPATYLRSIERESEIDRGSDFIVYHQVSKETCQV